MEEILSTSNPTVKYAARLQESKFRRAEGKYLIEGEITVKEAFLTGQTVETVFVSQDFRGDIAPYNGKTRLVRVPSFVLKKISATVEPQGIVAIVAKPVTAVEANVGHCVVLDGVSDPGNMGTILRTAAACGFDTVYAIDCVDAYNPKVVRSSMTGIFYTKVIECDRAFVTETLSRSHCILVADMQGESLYEQVFSHSRYAVVIGNEAHGVSAELRAAAQQTVSLPMKNVESLNAAVSAAVILYRIAYGKQS